MRLNLALEVPPNQLLEIANVAHEPDGEFVLGAALGKRR